MRNWSLLIIIVSFLLHSCKKKTESITPAIEVTNEFTQPEIIDQDILLNPSGVAPLCAKIVLITRVPTSVHLRVIGKNGPASDVSKEFQLTAYQHTVSVLGLYANFTNSVEITLLDENGKDLGVSTISLQTQELSPELPSITINTSLPGKKAGMTLVSYLGNAQAALRLPFIFDEFGDIRWYLDYSMSTVLPTLYYENGVERLRNGNLYFGDKTTNTIYETNMLGEILNSWTMQGYSFHHHVLEKPDGNFIVSVNRTGYTTIEDQIIEIERSTKHIIRGWDLRQSLQPNRLTLTANVSDWVHVNGLEYDERDNTLIVSGRTQGLIKLDFNNKVKWIMATHKGWGLAGDQTDLRPKLLKPLDNFEQLISDTSVLQGYTNHPDFEWNWYQHAPKLMPNGHLLIFDNGDKRNYTGVGPYSRAVEYEINEQDLTVQQVWQYGKERGSETYSRIVSDVDYLQELDHVIFSPGAGTNNGKFGKIMEVSRNGNSVFFEATLFSPSSYKGVPTFHRSERLNLYP